MHGGVLLPLPSKTPRIYNWSESVPLLKIKTSVLYRPDIEANLFTGWKSHISKFKFSNPTAVVKIPELLEPPNISLKNSKVGIGG